MVKGRREVTVSAVQFACTDDVFANAITTERIVRSAHAKGANIILLQGIGGYYIYQSQRKGFLEQAKPSSEGHFTVHMMQKLAKELGVVIPVSFFEEADNGHYNSVAVIDADGSDLGHYRMAHIPNGPGNQEKFFNPGDTGFKVFQTNFAKIGVGICWDLWFPEAARAMALEGAEILFYPTAIGSESQDAKFGSSDHWKQVMQGHAGANLVPLVAANRVGTEIIETELGNSQITFYGNSFIAGPSGEIIAAANDEDEDVVVAQFDLDEIKSKRYGWGVFRDRRPNVYGVLVKP